MEGKKAVVVMDYINEIIHPEGKFKGKGYADFAKENNTLENVRETVNSAREKGMYIIYVKVGFSPDYNDQPKNSLLFGKADEFEALKLGTWNTEFHESLDVREEDKIIIKNRISPFYGTDLDNFLKEKSITDLYLCGVATDLVVESTARDAHDRDYNVFVLSNCCAAGSNEDHEKSLNTLKKFSKVSVHQNLV